LLGVIAMRPARTLVAIAALVLSAARAVAAPPNDDCSAATLIVTLPFTDTVDNSSATGGSEDGVGCNTQSAFQTVWYGFSPAQSMQVQLNTQGSVVGDPASRTLKVRSRDTLIQVAVNPNGSASPMLRGGVLELRNPTTGETVVAPLPATGWRARTSGDGEAVAYSYRDPHLTAGPCKSVVIQTGKKLQASCRGTGLGFSLDEPTQGSLAVKLTVGTFSHCMLFGGAVPAETDTIGFFKAEDAAAPPTCS